MTNETNHDRPPRPQRRRLWSGASAFLITVAILITIRVTSLHGLPDIGDPFDIEAFSPPIPDETNAFVLYKRAFEKLGKNGEPSFEVWPAEWAAANPQLRQWLAESREALELWRQGTTRHDALYISPKTLNIETLLPVIQAMRSFARLATLEGTRLEAEGDLNGALDWYIATLRSSRHCGRRGVLIERLVGIAIGSFTITRLNAWAADPKVDAAMLRKALNAVVEADAMTPPASDSFKCEYISLINTLANPTYEDPAKLMGNSPWLKGKPPWTWSTGPGQAFLRAQRSIKQEPERSRRVYRLVIANWLAYCDRPRSKRPPFASLAPVSNTSPPAKTSGLELFVPEASAPESVKALPPEKLAEWFHSTIYAEIISSNFGVIDQVFRRDEVAVASLLVKLANELHKKEKGGYPEKVEELVGPYLKVMPEGYVPVEDVKTDQTKNQ